MALSSWARFIIIHKSVEECSEGIGSFHVKSTYVTTWPLQNWMLLLWGGSPSGGISARFHYFMGPRILRVDTWSCQKICFLVTSYLRKSGIISAVIETRNSFHAHFKAKKLPILMIYYTSIFSRVSFQGIKIDHCPYVSQNSVFLLFWKKICMYCLHVTII